MLPFVTQYQPFYYKRSFKGWFSVSPNFYVRTFANKIEATHERSLVSVKVEPRALSLFKLSTFYLASILFTWLKFTCVNGRSQKRVTTTMKKWGLIQNKPLATLQTFKEPPIISNKKGKIIVNNMFARAKKWSKRSIKWCISFTRFKGIKILKLSEIHNKYNNQHAFLLNNWDLPTNDSDRKF